MLTFASFFPVGVPFLGACRPILRELAHNSGVKFPPGFLFLMDKRQLEKRKKRSVILFSFSAVEMKLSAEFETMVS